MKQLKPMQFDKEAPLVRAFIRLPHELYGGKCTQSDDETRQLLLGTHPLSKYFTLYKFLIHDGKAFVGRFAITVYPNDPVAYIGFFECIDDADAARCLFDTARKFARSHGFEKIVGPVDASFWIKYRLKTNLFDHPSYTGEPYNLPYYYKLFSDNNYKVCEHYTSNIYPSVSKDYVDQKFTQRYESFLRAGYRIEEPRVEDFPKLFKELYVLLTDLYSDFPIFKPLEEEDFVKTFTGFSRVLNTKMLRFAFYNDKMVGFFVSVPDYGNLTANITPLRLLKILKLKKHPKQYIMLYLGADPEHRGLGKALSGAILQELKKSGLPSIGALTRDGKITQNYAGELIQDRYEYVLMEDIL